MIFDDLKNIGTAFKDKKSFNEVINTKYLEDVCTQFNLLGGNITEVTKKCNISNQSIIDYFNSLNGGKATLSGLQNYLEATGNSIASLGIKSKLASVGIGLLKGVLVSIASIAITTLITKGMQWFDNMLHQSKIAKENFDKIKDTIKELNQTITSHKERVSEIINEYDKLSQGVDLNTLENISLSNEDYKQFISLNKELGEMFPTLIQNTNKQGDTILSLGKNGLTAAEGLRELIAEEEKFNNIKIAERVPKYLENYNKIYKNTNNKIKTLQDDIDTDNLILENLSKFDINNLLNSSHYSYTAKTNDPLNKLYIDTIQEAYRTLYAKVDEESQNRLAHLISETYNAEALTRSFDIDLESLTYDEKQSFEMALTDAFSNLASEISGEVYDNQNKLDNKIRDAENDWKEVTNAIVQGMQEQYNYKQLNEKDKDIVNYLITNLDRNISNDIDKENPYEYVNKILKSINNISSEDKVKISKLIDGKLNTEEVKQIADEIEFSLGEIGIQLHINDVNFQTTSRRKVENYINSITKMGENNPNGNKERDELYDFLTQFSIDTDEEYEEFLQITAGIDNASEAMRTWIKVKQKAKEPIDLFDTTHLEQTESEIDDYVKKIQDLQNYLDKINENHQLSEEDKNQLNVDYGIVGNSLDDYSRQLQLLISQAMNSSDIMNSLANAIASCNNNIDKQRLVDLKNNLQGMGQKAKSLSNALSSLQSHAKLLYDVNKEIKDTGTISGNTLETILSTMPDLQDEVTAFDAGLIDTNELFREMEEAYAIDEKNYITYMTNKLSTNEEFWKKVKNNLSDYMLEMDKKYNLDFTHCKNTAEAKLRVEKELAAKQVELQESIFKAKSADPQLSQETWGHNASYIDIRDQYRPMIENDEIRQKKAELAELRKALNEFNTEINETLDLDTSWATRGDNNSDKNQDSTDKFEQNIDWASISLNRLKELADDAQKTFENTNGYNAQIEALKDWDTALRHLADGYGTANNEYTKLYNKQSANYKKLSSLVGNKNKLATYYKWIEEGNHFKVQEFKGSVKKNNNDSSDNDKKSKAEQIYEILTEMLDYKDKAEQAKNSEKDTLIQIENNEKTRKQLKLDKDTTYQEYLDAQLNNPDNGYDKQLKILQDKAKALEQVHLDNLEILKDENDQNKINKENEEYQKSIKENLRNQQEIQHKKLDFSYQSLKNAESEFKTQMDLNKAQGGLNTYDEYLLLINGSQTQQEILQQNLLLYQKEIESLKEGSQSYDELLSKINDCKQSIEDCKKSQIDWNNEILNLPIDYLKKQKDSLDAVNNALKSQLDIYSNIISSINAEIDRQIDEMNTYNTDVDRVIEINEGILSAANKIISDEQKSIDRTIEDLTIYYDKLTAPLENELSLLQETNEARSQALALQKAEYEFERAKNQHNVKVFKSGEGFVYESDNEEIRDKKNAYDDALYQYKITELQKQIDSYNKEKDLILYGIDKHSGLQAEKDKLALLQRQYDDLISYQDLWSLEQAKEYYGDSFKDDVLNGIFNPNNIQSDLNELDKIKKDNEEQIKELERKKYYLNKIISDAETKNNLNLVSQYAGIDLENIIPNLSFNQIADFGQIYDKSYKEWFDNEQIINNINQDITALESFMKNLDGTQSSFKECFNNMIVYLQNNNKNLLTQLGLTNDKIQKIIDTSKVLQETTDKNSPEIYNEIDKNTKKVIKSFNNMNTKVEDAQKVFDGIMNDYIQSSTNAATKVQEQLAILNGLNTPTQERLIQKGIETAIGSIHFTNGKVMLGKKHSGMKTGFVGNTTSTSEKKRFEELCLKPLSPNEIPIIALKDEAVLTSIQQQQVLDNFKRATSISLPIPNTLLTQTHTTLSFDGDIIMNGVNNVDSLALAIKQQLPTALLQQLHKK